MNEIRITGMSFPTILGIAFIILKLTKVIAWSWWWVLCPFWAIVPLVIILFIGGAIAGIIKQLKKD